MTTAPSTPDRTPTLDTAKQALATPTPKMEALIEVLYVTALADEDFGPKEREQFTANVVGLCDGALKPEDVKGVILKLKFRSKEGRPARLKAVAERLKTPEDREHAFALACSMALADGVVLDEERALIDELRVALALDDARMDEILEELKSLEIESDS